MFHLYFGAFDIVLYLGASYFAMALANAICDSMEQPAAARTEAVESAPATPRATVAVPQRSKPQQQVKVSVRG